MLIRPFIVLDRKNAEAWRSLSPSRDLRGPEFLIVDGEPGARQGDAAVGEGLPVQRCVPQAQAKLTHAPERLHDELTADYNYMIYA